MHYFRFIQAGQHLETHVWTTNKAEVIHKKKTYSRAAQMSSPILSLKATWSNAIRTETFKPPLPWEEGRQATQQALRQRPRPAAGQQVDRSQRKCPSWRPACCVCHCLCLVWFLKMGCQLHTQTVTVLVWHWPSRCDFCLQPGNWPSDGLCAPL